MGELKKIADYQDEICVTKDMYLKAFNELTDIKNQMHILADRIESTQIDIEEMYIGAE